MPYEILLQHASIVSCLCVFGISHFGLYYLYSSTISRKLEDKRASNKPGELIERALSALQAVDCEQDSFTKDPHIEEMVREINKLTYEMKKILERR